MCKLYSRLESDVSTREAALERTSRGVSILCSGLEHWTMVWEPDIGEMGRWKPTLSSREKLNSRVPNPRRIIHAVGKSHPKCPLNTASNITCKNTNIGLNLPLKSMEIQVRHGYGMTGIPDLDHMTGHVINKMAAALNNHVFGKTAWIRGWTACMRGMRHGSVVDFAAGSWRQSNQTRETKCC